MTPMRRGLLGAGLAAPALAAGAGASHAKPPQTNLRIVYNRSAQYHRPDRNPIIVIPGILGTRLVDKVSKATVWGAFDGLGSSLNGAGARRLALPILGEPDRIDSAEGLSPTAVLDKVSVRLLGIPFELRQYAQILATLGAGGYRDETLGLNGIDYGRDHFTCFQFPYDWRRDNAETAGALKRFMDAKRLFVAEQYRKRFSLEVAPEAIKFDVVAHSMGALMFRYFLRYGGQELTDDATPTLDWSGAGYVERAILVAPPNAGSALSLRFLIEGEDFGRPLLPYYPPAVLGSFASVYQLLPRAEAGPLIDAAGRRLDPLDIATWRDRGWGLASPAQDSILASLLPQVGDPARRHELAMDRLQRLLQRAKRFQASLDGAAEAPAGLEPFLVAGDGVDTAKGFRLDPVASRLTPAASGPGDGTVTRASALFDQRTDANWTPRVQSPLRFRNVLLTNEDHLGITRSATFNDNVLFWLLEEPRGGGVTFAV
jgi:hypothetical protein